MGGPSLVDMSGSSALGSDLTRVFAKNQRKSREKVQSNAKNILLILYGTEHETGDKNTKVQRI